jgi:hypothetical protein
MKSVHGVVAGLDVHKKSVVDVVLHVDCPDEDDAAGVFGTTQFGLNELIAWKCCEVESEYARSGYLQPLRCGYEAEQTGNERNLPGDVALRQPPYLPFANDVHCLDTLNRSPRRVK